MRDRNRPGARVGSYRPLVCLVSVWQFGRAWRREAWSAEGVA